MTSIFLIPVFILGLWLSLMFRRKPGLQPRNDLHPAMSRETADALVATLATLDYFKYTRPDQLAKVKSDIALYLHHHGVMPNLVYYTRGACSPDLRTFDFSESLPWEEEGLDALLQNLQRLFEKTGQKIELHATVMEATPDGNFRLGITLHGEQYLIFPPFAPGFAKMLNGVLAAQQCPERFYIAGKPWAPVGIFLTDAQLRFLREQLPGIGLQ